MLKNIPILVISVVVGVVFATAIIQSLTSKRGPAVRAEAFTTDQSMVNAKLTQIASELASTDHPKAESVAKAISTVKGELQKGRIVSGEEFYLGSLILSASKQSEDVLLAHDFAVGAMVMGQTKAKTIAAHAMDRYLAAVGKGQRYGTLAADGKVAVASKNVTDRMRFILGIPSLRVSQSKISRDPKWQPFRPEWPRQYSQKATPAVGLVP